MAKLRNREVASAWASGTAGCNHTGTFHTDGKKLYSYELQIGDTTSSGVKVVKDYTAHGSYGFRSQTTSCHIGLVRYIKGYDTGVI